MADFNIAVEKVLLHEGGWTPGLPGDPGGETNFGISKRAYPNLDIKNLSREAAIEIYHKDFWRPYMEQEPIQALANCALDCAVNQGPSFAHTTYLATAPDLKAFQDARLKRYQALNKPQFMYSWQHRTMDV